MASLPNNGAEQEKVAMSHVNNGGDDEVSIEGCGTKPVCYEMIKRLRVALTLLAPQRIPHMWNQNPSLLTPSGSDGVNGNDIVLDCWKYECLLITLILTIIASYDIQL